MPREGGAGIIVPGLGVKRAPWDPRKGLHILGETGSRSLCEPTSFCILEAVTIAIQGVYDILTPQRSCPQTLCLLVKMPLSLDTSLSTPNRLSREGEKDPPGLTLGCGGGRTEGRLSAGATHFSGRASKACPAPSASLAGTP